MIISLCLTILIYSGLYLYDFWQTPLGMQPVLDGAENIILSKQILNGMLEPMPFYRSMLYPATLYLLRLIGYNDDKIMFGVGLLGLICHMISVILIGYISGLVWKNKSSIYMSMALYGFCPIIVFFIGEPLDANLSLMLMLSSLAAFFTAYDKVNSKLFALSGFLLGLCIMCRANFLPIALIFLFEFKLTKKNKALFALIVSLMIYAIINFQIGGEFRILPWQGSYNFYAANYKGAIGKYFQHTIDVSERPYGSNPTRVESEILYTKITGKKINNINEFNKFWYLFTLNSIKNNFNSWIKLTLKKIYYLINNFEQYNNKTFSYHKEKSYILKYNPICFGLIFVLFVTAISIDKDKKQKEFMYISYTALISLSVGIIAFYVSARFRIMIVPILIIIASNVFSLKKKNLSIYKSVAVLLSIFVTFSSFCNANDKSTYVYDMILEANSASHIGLYQYQILKADEALSIDESNTIAAKVKLSGVINLVIQNINNKVLMPNIKKQILLLRKENLFYPNTILLDLYYSLFYEKNAKQAYKDLSILPPKQYCLLPIILLSGYWNYILRE